MEILSERLEHVPETTQQELDDLFGFAGVAEPIPAHDEIVFVVRDWGRYTAGPDEARIATLRYPAEWTRERIMAEMEADSREDRLSWSCGD